MVPARAGLARPAPPADVLLADGRVARIRPLDPQDRERLRALHADAHPDNLRMRFFTVGRHIGDRYVERLCARSDGVLAALVVEAAEELLAVGSLHTVTRDSAEVALFVADDAHGRGLGTLLLEHLAAIARRQGVTTLCAEILAENHPMLRVIDDAGFTVSRRIEEGVVLLDLSTALTSAAVDASDLRDCAAEARSLHPLLYPRTVALVGVRRDGTGVGAALLRAIRAGGYRGELYVVHPDASEIGRVAAYPDLSVVPRQLDLVLVTVPAARVRDVLADACRARAATVVVVSSGFKEAGPDGRAAEASLVRLAREHSVRLVGPNCLGVMGNDPAVRLNATLAPALPPSGGLAVVSQSGGATLTLVERARRTGLGIAGLVSLGNKADVSGNDLLAAWLDDPHVTAAALLVESFGNVRRFARLARRFAERKPLLVVPGGRAAWVRRAAGSPPGAAIRYDGVPRAGIIALFAQTGVIECGTPGELADTARLLAEQPLPRGPRLGVVSNVTGVGVVTGAAAEALGLVVAEPAAAAGAGPRGVVDLGASVTPAVLGATVRALAGSDDVDAVLVALVGTVAADLPGVVAAVGAAGPTPGKPLLLVVLGGDGTPRGGGGPSGATWFETVDEALTALAHQVRYAAWRESPHQPADDVDETAPAASRAVAQDLLTGPEAHEWLSVTLIRRLLAPYGLTPLGEVADEAEAAVRAADRLGYPVVVKVDDARLLHRSERGLVRVGLTDEQGLRQAVGDFARVLGTDHVPVVVQPMLTGRVEVALGLVRGSVFGPLVTVGAGGTSLDARTDRAHLVPPFDQLDARRAIRSLRVWPLLEGYRGAPRVDVSSLERALVRVGRLAADVPEIAELDLEAVLTGAARVAIVDARLRLAPAVPLQTGIPRQLHAPS